MSNKYFGQFSSRESVLSNFEQGEYDYETGKHKETPPPENFPTEEEILFASYGGRSYEGDALVIFKRGEQLYEVNGSHCSCNGLEGQWEPEATTREALAMQVSQQKYAPDSTYGIQPDCYRLRENEHDDDAIEAFIELFKEVTE